MKNGIFDQTHTQDICIWNQYQNGARRIAAIQHGSALPIVKDEHKQRSWTKRSWKKHYVIKLGSQIWFIHEMQTSSWSNMSTAHTFLWELCTKGKHDKIESHTDFKKSRSHMFKLMWCCMECCNCLNNYTRNSKGFGIKQIQANPCNQCMSNPIIIGEQQRVTWHVDSLKASHLNWQFSIGRSFKWKGFSKYEHVIPIIQLVLAGS